ncbi:C69 family dipeptidase [Bifidobacterium sp. ESL0763]|nr:C69 family dipeptidase [Bifidobacterium sp. ESL0763]MDF7664456.1 C69 family dipeptidase [Bifidobacterium sp. ESL0763]
MPCTTLLVGKNASYDGSTMIARNDDSGHGRYDPKRLVAVRPEDQPRHYRSVLSHVEIELPDDPCAYLIAPNALRNRGILAEAGVSERNVAMSATETIAVNERVLGADPMVALHSVPIEAGEWSARPNAGAAPSVDGFWASVGEPEAYDAGRADDIANLGLDAYLEADAQAGSNGSKASANAPAAASTASNTDTSATATRREVPGGIGEEDLITLVLPYVSSAREGVLRLGALLERYGTYESNGVSISDADEVWYVETIGGHHWIARRVPDDCYAAIPNQLGLDDFDLDEALDDSLGNKRDYLCSGDLREFIAANHLDRTMGSASGKLGRFNPRVLFGTATAKDHIYNTPRAWYMQRCLNPSEDWDSPAARYTPISDDIPWCRRPESKVSVEDVDNVLSSHYEDTPYDPYGRLGTPETRHRYRPIGISRTGHLAIMQIRGYAPEAWRAVMWLAFGSQPTTFVAPFYTNVGATPAYLRQTTGEVSTSTLYWTNRLIAVIADSHFDANSNAVEAFREDIASHGHAFVAESDAKLDEVVSGSGADEAAEAKRIMEAANQRMADYLEARSQQLLGRVLCTTSDMMQNSFALSDRPQ